jgi:hypothetical protein
MSMSAGQVLAILKIVFLKNGYWKLLSLVIAVLIHFSIRSEISHLRVMTIPVETDFDAASVGAAIESVEPRSVQITLRGSYSDVNKLDDAQMSCVVRPKQKPSSLLDSVAVNIRTSNLRGVRGVRVVAIEPDTAVVKFDVPMSLKLEVAPPAVQGKARGRVQLVYAQTNAVVKGSRRNLSLLDAERVRIQTDVIDVEGRSQSYATRVRLFPPGDAINVAVDPADMVVNVVIISEKATALLERVPVVVVQPSRSANRWVTDPAWVDIEVTGRSEEVKAITFGQLLASVDGNVPVTPLSVTNEAPVMVHVQQGVVVDEVKPVPPVVKLIPVPLDPVPSVQAVVPNGER